MKHKSLYPLMYKLGNNKFIVWLSRTKCYVVEQLTLLS